MTAPTMPAPVSMQQLNYANAPHYSSAVRYLTLLLLIYGLIVFVRHLLYWTNTLIFVDSSPEADTFLSAGFAAMEICGYLVAAVGCGSALRGRLPASKIVVLGAGIAAAAILFNTVGWITFEVFRGSFTRDRLGNDALFWAWRVVASGGHAFVPGTIGAILLFIKS